MSATGTTATSANGKGKTPPPTKLKSAPALNDPSAFVGKQVVLYGKPESVIAQMYGDIKQQGKGEWAEFEAELLSLNIGQDGTPLSCLVRYDEGRVWQRTDYISDLAGVVISLRERKPEEEN